MDTIADLPPGADMAGFLRRGHAAFIDGATVAVGGDAFPVFDPATGRAIAEVVATNGAQVQRAIGSARAAFDDERWRGRRPADRERILLRFADLVEGDADFLAELETREQGKSITIARHVAVGGAVEWMRYAAGLATKITGRTLDVSLPTPPGTRATAYTIRQPIGVVAGIVPWNFPLSIALWKIVPALAAGCSIVLKPSEFTPLTALRLAELAMEAGVPAGTFNVVTGDADVGRMLVESPQIDKISFTGSTAAGRAIGRTAADRLARVSLELGGKNPAIVLADADVDATVGGLMVGGFFNQGQVCAAASRLYVEAPIFEAVAAALEAAVKGMSVGPGMDPAAQINPLVSAQHRDRVAAFLEDAEKRGAELLQGAPPPAGDGYYVRPTLIANPDAAIRLNREEVFGPVVTITRVADAEEALARANDTDMGLAASLWTRDLKATMHLVPRIQAGTVWVNSHIPIDPAMPFGGMKQSGIGRDFGPDWVTSYTEEKSVCIIA